MIVDWELSLGFYPGVLLGFRSYPDTGNGLENHVIFLGRIPQNIELLSITDCNILSSENEGLPNSVIETLAMGKPFLGTNVNGISEVVGEAYPIPLFQIGDHKILKINLVKIFNEEFDINSIKEYSLNRIKLFSIHNLIENYLQLFNSRS